MAGGYPIFVKRDLDGFFGLAIDNLVQLLLILALCLVSMGFAAAKADASVTLIGDYATFLGYVPSPVVENFEETARAAREPLMKAVRDGI